MPAIRDYTQATFLEPTDAFVIDRIGVGTLYVEAGLFGPSCLTYFLNGAGSPISTGTYVGHWVPFNCTITGVTLLSDVTTNCVVDIWVAPYASYPPTIANTITAAAIPTITAAKKYQNTTLTGWTTAIPANSTIWYDVVSVSAATQLTIALSVLK